MQTNVVQVSGVYRIPTLIYLYVPFYVRDFPVNNVTSVKNRKNTSSNNTTANFWSKTVWTDYSFIYL